MKQLMKLANAFAFAIYCLFLSCSPENVTPGNVQSSNQSPELVANLSAHPVVDPECSSRIKYPMMDGSGGMVINYHGPLGAPTGGSDPWGSVTVVNSDEDVVMEVDMALGWYVEAVETYSGGEAGLNLVNGIPEVGEAWVKTDVNPLINATQLSIPIESLSDECFVFAMRLSVLKLDFFQGVDEDSRTTLWVNNPSWNDPAQPEMNSPSMVVNQWCVIPCAPDTTHETDGNCQGCQSENTVEIIGCEKAVVTSCKDLSNVVLLFTDNTFQKFEKYFLNLGYP